MKTLLVVTCVCLFVIAGARSVSASGPDDLHISLRLTTGERGRDTSSQTTTITVERDAIVWERTFSGRRNATPSLRKEFKLPLADKGQLLELIASNDLLVTDSIELPQEAPVFYFRISVDLTLGGKKGAINISGPRAAVQVKEERLYQNTLVLIKELFRIMNSQDKSVRFEELVSEPKLLKPGTARFQRADVPQIDLWDPESNFGRKHAGRVRSQGQSQVTAAGGKTTVELGFDENHFPGSYCLKRGQGSRQQRLEAGIAISFGCQD